jgi:hypothetical protein
METTFKNRTYKITSSFEPSPLLAAEGMKIQHVIEGKKGATLLLQEFTDGTRRTISPSGRVETEYPLA